MLVTTADAAKLFKVPTGTLLRWAHEDRWPRDKRIRPRLWDFDKVQASYDRRRASLTSP
jgi:hypothetical protein